MLRETPEFSTSVPYPGGTSSTRTAKGFGMKYEHELRTDRSRNGNTPNRHGISCEVRLPARSGVCSLARRTTPVYAARTVCQSGDFLITVRACGRYPPGTDGTRNRNALGVELGYDACGEYSLLRGAVPGADLFASVEGAAAAVIASRRSLSARSQSSAAEPWGHPRASQ